MIVAMEAHVRIEPMTDADADAVASMEGPTRMTLESVREELRKSWSRIWVVREGGTPGAVVAFVITWHVSDELHVLNVATRADRRRRGIGRAVLSEAIAYGRRSAVRHVLLEVRRSNRAAIAMYRALGFFAMGVRARYYPDDEDAVEMVLVLDPVTGAVVLQNDQIRLDS
jgi:ribosomal-protein-alanine N-acetyltransferase